MTHSLKDRVVELRRVKASELMVNAGNWRLHPQFQRDALRGALYEVGIAGALIAYESKRQGGLTLIDGHLRQEDYPDTEWPVLVLDVDDKEADVLLATLDPLAAMAEANEAKLSDLLAMVEVESAALRELFDGLVEPEEAMPQVDIEPQMDRAAELQEKWQVDVDLKSTAKVVLIVFLSSQKVDFDAAVEAILPKGEIDEAYLASQEVYEGWVAALQRVRSEMEIVSIPTAVAQMARLAMEALDARQEVGSEG